MGLKCKSPRPASLVTSLAITATLFLAACGGGGGASSDTAATTPQTPAPYGSAGLTHLHRISITETIRPAQWFIKADTLKKIGAAWHVGLTERRRNTLFDTEIVNHLYGPLGSQSVALGSLNRFSAYAQVTDPPFIELNGNVPFIYQSGTPPSGGTPMVWAYPASYTGFSQLAVGFVRSKAIVRSFGNRMVLMDYQLNQGGSGGAAYMNVLDYPANPAAATSFPADTLVHTGILLDPVHAFLNFDFDKFQDASAFYAYLSRGDRLYPYQGGLAAGHLHLLSHDGTAFAELAPPLALAATASTDGTLWTPYDVQLVKDGADATKPLIVIRDDSTLQVTVARFDGAALTVVSTGATLPAGFNSASPMAALNGTLYVAVGARLYRLNGATFERLHGAVFDEAQIVSIDALSADVDGVVVALARNDAAYALRYLIDVVKLP